MSLKSNSAHMYVALGNTWNLGDSKTNHLLFLAYRNAASVLLLGMESVDRYKFFLGRNKPSPHYCSDRELKELGL